MAKEKKKDIKKEGKYDITVQTDLSFDEALKKLAEYNPKKKAGAKSDKKA